MMSTLTLPVSVEERLAGWVRIQESRRKVAPAKQKPHPTVTISRQFGCEGFPLAVRLQTLFEQASGEPWHIFDKELIEKVSQDEQISLRVLTTLEEPSRYLEDYGFHPRGSVTTDQALNKIAVHILHFAREGNAIIVGRGGAAVCRKLANCFHFRLEAGLDWRVASLMKRLGISRREALERERAQSKLRDHFLQEYLGTDMAHAVFYDAVFNNERHGVEEIAAAIMAYVRTAWRGQGQLLL
ncbi:MAG: cytidylate kinase-like family protein [Holophaga sp.]|jgi:cytidylate kinase